MKQQEDILQYIFILFSESVNGYSFDKPRNDPCKSNLECTLLDMYFNSKKV